MEVLSKRKLMQLRATHAPGERAALADSTDLVSASSGDPRETSAHPELTKAVRSGILSASELARHYVRQVQDQDRRAPKGLGWDISGLLHSLGSSPTTRPTQREVCKECSNVTLSVAWGQGAWWCQDCWQRWREATRAPVWTPLSPP